MQHCGSLLKMKMKMSDSFFGTLSFSDRHGAQTAYTISLLKCGAQNLKIMWMTLCWCTG
jgi:hypothetical protein